jgi:hypothetical protein
MSRPFLVTLVVAAIGAIATVLLFTLAPGRAAAAYLAAVGFLLTLSLGALALAALLRLSGARWAVPLHRIYDALSGCLPLVLLLVVPIVLYPAAFYPWARGDFPGRGGLIHSPRYFAPVPFALRVVAELAVLVGIEEAIRRRVIALDRGPRLAPAGSIRTLSAVALLATAFIGSSAIDDLIMSAAGEWSSDVFGLYALIGGFSAAVAALAVANALLRRELGTMAAHAHAIGNVQLTATALWGYLAFALFLLVWIADLPREVTFFTSRTQATWRAVFILLAIGHFVVPLLLLLRQRPKRDARYVAVVGGWILAMHALDSTWLVVPGAARTPNLLDFGPIVLIGGAGTLIAIHRFRRHPALAADNAALAARFAYKPA